MQVWPGSSYPLGATHDGNGTNFALFSEGAEKVELCLFEEDGTETCFELIEVDWGQAVFSYEFGDPDSFNDEDSAAHMMKGVVINPFFDWSGDRQPKIPYAESVIYEAHVKGLTQLHPDIPEDIR